MTQKLLQDLPNVENPEYHGLKKKFKILLINPNNTSQMTMSCLQMVEQHLAPDVVVYGYTAPKPSPLVIECHLDGVLSSAVAFKDVYQYVGHVDALLVACFSDHPLVNCLREEFDIPTCGIFEAGLYSARLLGGRFGVVTTVYRSSIRHGDAIRSLGLDGYCAGLLSTNLKVGELHSKPREEVLKMMKNVALKLVEEKGADVIVLGCAGMADMQEAVTRAVQPKGVQVIDGVVAGINILTGLVRSGLKTSSRGLFASSLESRASRFQDYL